MLRVEQSTNLPDLADTSPGMMGLVALRQGDSDFQLAAVVWDSAVSQLGSVCIQT